MRALLLGFVVLDVDGVTSGLEEAKSTVEEVRVDKLRHQIIDEFDRNFLMNFDREELWVTVFENEFNLNADRQHEHRHLESPVVWIVRVGEVHLRPDGLNRYEHLLHVVHVKWQTIEVPKDIPVGQVGDQTNQFGRFYLFNLLEDALDPLEL